MLWRLLLIFTKFSSHARTFSALFNNTRATISAYMSPDASQTLTNRSRTEQRKEQDIFRFIWSLYLDMCPMMDVAVMKQHSELDADYLVLASIETSSSDDESESDEGDVFSVSCHGSHFKQLKEQPKQCDELAIKRRKLHTQLNLLNSDLMSMTFGGSRTSPDQPSCGFVFDKRARKVPRNKRLSRKIDATGSKTRRISPRTA